MIDEKCWDDAHLMSVLTSRPQVECYEKLIQERKTADLESQLHQWQELEAAVCPEDVGFEEYIKALQSQLQQEREKRQQAEADNAGIDAKYRNAIGVIEKAILDGNINYMGFQNQIDAFIQYAANPHPGAALLEEVEQLRAVRSAAEELHFWNSGLRYSETYTELVCKLADALAVVKGSD